MILITGIKIPFEENEEQAVKSALKRLDVKKSSIRSAHIFKRSLDLRRGHLAKVYSVIVETDVNEDKLVKKLNKNEITKLMPVAVPCVKGDKVIEKRPLVVGFGPAGMFCGLILAQNGFKPIIIERGGAMEKRDAVTEHFFATGELDENTNVQFGEGGAGTYSDGKLTTRINDQRARLVIDELVKHGAPEEIKVNAKPHVGTDLLKGIVVSIRKEIEALGGSVLFDCKAEKLVIENGAVKGVVTQNGTMESDCVVIAIGHSARDFYKSIYSAGIHIEPKSFAVGARIEHRQQMINESLYGDLLDKYQLPQGEYALAQTVNGRGCYTFCMCPGGKVMASTSELLGTVTNGMSYHARDGENANAAVVVSVGAGDFEGNDPLAGVEFQRMLEHKAYEVAGGGYKAPLQLFGDFEQGRVSTKLGNVNPTYNRGFEFCDLNKVLPDFVTNEMKSGIRAFGKKVRGFDSDDAVLTGVETRTSAPIRIVRNENLESTNVKGLYPCGEGAGYAGGIMSAAVD
ncbi:MAG: hypothetical protein IKU13_07835, partial [Clostridia bacterium]|nr:hypothetical protein [Clostridia bacterium]